MWVKREGNRRKKEWKENGERKRKIESDTGVEFIFVVFSFFIIICILCVFFKEVVCDECFDF